MTFPTHRPGRHYLTEGGFETEVLYKWGFELPQFAVFPLLEDATARQVMLDIYRRILDVARKHDVIPLLGSFDYRASADWGALLGYDQASLDDAVEYGITLLRDLVRAHAPELPEAYVAGYIGPRGDAYGRDDTITANEAEDYHTPQLLAQKRAKADLVWAMTFNSVPEAIGVVRAARAARMPLAVSFSLDSRSRLSTGPTVAAAIAEVDAATNGGPDFYTLNCSHPIEFEPALVPGDWTRRLRGIRPNAAKMDKIALCKLGHLEDGDPVELGQQMSGLLDRYPHFDIWGGCCGTDHRHADQICAGLPLNRTPTVPSPAVGSTVA